MQLLSPSVVLSVLALVPAPSSRATEPAPAPLATFLVDYAPTRADVLANPNPTETQGIVGHMQTMAKLAAEGVVTWGGKTGEGHALVLLLARDRADAERIAGLDPAVQKGVFTFRVTDFDVKLSTRFGDTAVQEPGTRVLRFERELAVALEDVWQAWTDGAAFERATGWRATIEPRIAGKFEIAFDPNAPKGQAGSEGCRVLAVVPHSVLAFEWNAPPSFGKLRSEHTNVVVRFEALGEARTRIVLEHAGFGRTEEWSQVGDYFEKAWPSVLDVMTQRLAPGR